MSRFKETTRARSPEVLRDFERELRDGWSVAVAARRAGTYIDKVYEWAGEYPEWKAVLKLKKEGKRG